MEIIKVLVLGAGSNVSQGIIKALRESHLPMKIIGACISEYSKGLYMCDEGYICPYASDEKFIPWVVDFCNKHGVDIIFTGVEENIIQLAKNEKILKENTRAIFVSSPYDKILIGQDKFLTCEWLKDSGFNYPQYQLWAGTEQAKSFAENVGYPIIAKPRNGKSSHGIRVLNSDSDVEKWDDINKHIDNYVLEQYIGDENSEFTIGCYTDKNGKLQSLLPMQRKLYNGTTVWARTVENQNIIDECSRICDKFKPIGPFNIQLRIDKNGEPICFEMNIRFSGTTAIRSRFGFQDVKAMLFEYIYNKDISECFQIKSGEVFRFDGELFLQAHTTEKMRQNSMIEDIHSFLYSEGSRA